MCARRLLPRRPEPAAGRSRLRCGRLVDHRGSVSLHRCGLIGRLRCLRRRPNHRAHRSSVTQDWFVLALEKFRLRAMRAHVVLDALVSTCVEGLVWDFFRVQGSL